MNTQISFKVSQTKLVYEDLKEFYHDKYLKSKFYFTKLDFPASVFVHKKAFSGYNLTDETCVVEDHVAYSFAGIFMDEDYDEPKIDSAIYRVSDELPEILIYIGPDPA